MEREEALGRLEAARQWGNRSASAAATGVAWVSASFALVLGVIADTNLWWLVGLLILGMVGLLARVSVRGRFDWSRRSGVALVYGGAFLALAAYVLVQFPVRAADWVVPNTIGGATAAVVILLICRAGLVRMARR